ncbi:Disks large-associated protein 5, partial [Ophiophagus hannah]
MATNFSTRYKKDLSIDTLKTKIVRRKSTIQKENRYKEFNKGRQFGLVDVNTQPSRDKATSQLGEIHKGCVPKPKRMEMLQRYKAEKELRRLKEQRDKPTFKCGQFKPDLPSFLSKASQIPVLKKSKENVESSYTSKGRNRQIAQQVQKQIYIDKPSKQENKGNLPQKRVTIKGKQQKEIIKERTTVVHNTNQDIPVKQEKEVKLQPAEISEQKDFLDQKNMSAPRKRNRSFAPQNFVFQPPKGLTTYKVKPMTPSRANMFLSPNLSWSPAETTKNILQSETEKLTSFCLEWDKTIEIDIPEEAKDLVRTTIGQTRLLMAERFKQFEGLIDNCEFRRGEKETTYTDLDGFWDMVNFQVEDINKKFENLKKLEVNGWQMVDDAQTHRPAKKKPILRRTAKAAGGSAERRAARKRFAAVKAAIKNKTKEGLAAEASGQVIPKEAERIFDGGFFRIESPAKPFPGRTPKSTDRISQWRTPRSANKALLQNCAEICVLKQDTSSTSKAVPPIPDPKAFSDSAGTNHLGSASKQSGIQTTEELCVRTDIVEIAT